MASKNVVGVTVDVNSQNLVIAEQRASKLNKTLNQVGAPRKIGGSSAAAKASDQTDYAVTRGITGQTGAAGRDFAKQAQGLGGLVHLYATFAANIFAVSMAFTAFDRAFQYQKMIEGAKVLESTTGVALRSIASNMTKVSDGALSMQESLKFTALASSAGISSTNIEKLTKVAKGASLALGRDMGDAIDRIIRGVSKLEPELIDELGITVKSMQAYRDYAKQLGVSTESLTNYQKTAAYTQAVILEGTRKFGDVANQIEASPFNKVMGELKNSAITLANIFNKVLTPFLSIFANNVELVYAGILLTIKSLAIRALPEMTKLFSVSPDVIRQRTKALDDMKASMKVANNTQIAQTKARIAEELRLEEVALKTKEQRQLRYVQELAKSGFKNAEGQIAKNIVGAGSIRTLKFDDRVVGAGIRGGIGQASRGLAAAEAKGSIVEAEVYRKRLESLRLLHSELNGSSKLSKEIAVDTARTVGITQTLVKSNNALNIEKAGQVRHSKLELDTLKSELALQKLIKAEAVERATYQYGPNAGKVAAKAAQADINKARKALLMTNDMYTRPTDAKGPGKGVTIKDGGPRELNALGNAALMAGTGMDVLKTKAAAAGATISRAFGVIGMAVTIIYALYSAIKFGLNYFGLLNKHSEELSNTLKESSSVLDAATSSLAKYTSLQRDATFSISSLVDANNIAATTFDQVSDSISKQIDIFKKWQNNQTDLSAWWDNAFGTSSFDKLKTNLSDQIKAASKFAPNDITKEALSGISNKVSNATGIGEITKAQEDYNKIAGKTALNLKNTNDAYKNLGEGIKTARISLDQFYDKSEIKNEKLRAVVDSFKELKANSDITTKLRVLAEIPQDSALFGDLPKKLQEIILLQVKIGENAAYISELERNRLELNVAKEKESFLDIISTWIVEKNAYIIQSIILSIESLWEKTIRSIKDWTVNLGNAFLQAAISFDFSKIADSFARGLSNMIKAVVETVTGIKAIKDLGNLFNKDKIQEANDKGIAAANAKANSSGQVSTNVPTPLVVSPNRLREEEYKLKEANRRADSLKAKQNANIGPNGSILNSGLGTAITTFSNKGDKNARGSNSDNKLKRLQEELKLQKTLTEFQELENKLAEKRLGFISETNILLTYESKVKEEQKQYEIDLHTIEKARESADRNKKLASSEIISNEALALKAAKANHELRLKNLTVQKQEALIADKMKEYDATKAFTNKWELQARQTSLDLLVASNSLSEKEIRDKTDILTIEFANLELSRAQAAFDADNDNHNASITLALAKQNKERVEGLIVAKQVVESEKDLAKDLDRRLEMVSLIQDLSDKAYPDAQINKALILKKAEYDRNKILLEHNQNSEKNQDIAEKIKNTKLETLEIEKRIALHEQNKKDFTNLSATDRVQTLYDEASKQAADFARNMKDAVTGTFDAVYAGMDAAIDELTTKWMNSESASIKDLVTTFRNAAAEEFRKLAAEQMKSSVRNLVKDILGNFFEVKPSAEDLAKKAAEAGIAMLDKADLSNEYLGNLEIITKVQNENLKKLTDKLVGVGAGVAVNESDLSSTAKAKEASKSNEDIIDTAIEAATQSTGFLDKIKEGFNSFFGPEGSILGGLKWVMTTMQGLWTQLVTNLMATSSGSSSGGGGGLLGTLFSIGKSFIGGLGGGGGTFLDGGVPMAGLTDAAYLPALMANGGIMTEYGALKLSKYANGGIANSPQVAIYGEGKRPEAYVPLPDGRSIPVTMDGSSNGGVMINITINAQTGQTNADASSGNGGMKELGNLVATVVKQTIVNEQRSGGLLNKRT